MTSIFGVSIDLTPQSIIATLLALYAGHWLWNNYLSGVRLAGSSSAAVGDDDGRALTSRSRLLDELNPLPNDLDLQEAEEEERNDDSISANQKEAKKGSTVANTTTSDSEAETTADNLHLATEEATNNTNPPLNRAEQDSPPPQEEPTSAVADEPSSSSSVPLSSFSNKTQDHPGLKAFWYWCDIEASLYRVYNPGRLDGQDVVPPYIPKSRRGKVQVHMLVTNQCSKRKVQVFWINYKGNEESKGVIRKGRTWTQYSWIEHPWIFRDADTGQVLLYYIPDRIIPSTVLDSTTSASGSDDNDDGGDPDMGIHRFSFRDPDWGSPFLIGLDDPVLPFPAEHKISTVEDALQWTIRHMLRVTETRPGITTDWGILLQYFYNILQHPQDNAKYRRIRIANRTFSSHVWNTAARGLFLAAGFVEQGAYAELGTAEPFPAHRLKDLSDFVMRLEQWKHQWPTLTGTSLTQPEGATDGSGRAGFGVAGSNAFRT